MTTKLEGGEGGKGLSGPTTKGGTFCGIPNQKALHASLIDLA